MLFPQLPLNCRSFNPPLPRQPSVCVCVCVSCSPSRRIAGTPGGRLKELVRLSSQGFHLVILPLGIHTTLLPPEAACLHTDSLKETSHCHFNSRSLSPLLPFLRRLSTPSAPLSTYSSLIPFHVVFLPLPPRVSNQPSVFFFSPSLFDSVCLCNCVRAEAVSCYGCPGSRGWGAICRERLIWRRSRGYIHKQHPAASRARQVAWLYVCVF